MFISVLSKIYVINLKRCTERKNHIINEFKRVGIQRSKYEFFDAVDKSTDEVKDLMLSNFVHKFPSCFRCKKMKCSCENNVLLDCQIGNWCSYINLMKEIVACDHKGLVMICEDDIKFSNMGVVILNNILEKKKLRKYGILGDEKEIPVLIRVGSCSSYVHIYNELPKFVKRRFAANPCFIINVAYAKSFLKNLVKINRTSDTYIHRTIPNIDKTVRDFSIIPQPIYELSAGGDRRFGSTIHPRKGDKRRNKHIKKIVCKNFLCIGYPQSGIKIVARYLKQMGKNGDSGWKMAVCDDSSVSMSVKDRTKLRGKFYFNNVVIVMRDPKDIIPDIVRMNKGGEKEGKRFLFMKKEIEKKFGDVLSDSGYSDVEMAILMLVYWYKLCEKVGSGNAVVCKIEDPVNGLKRFNESGVKIKTVKFNNKDSRNNSIDMGDVRDKIKELLKEFCVKYGYDDGWFTV